MSKLSLTQVEHLAKLAHLDISNDQKQQFTRELTDVLGYVEQIGKVKTKQATVTETITGLTNVLRNDDTTGQCLELKEALKNAPDVKDGYFKVKAVFES